MKGYSIHIGLNTVDQDHYTDMQNLRSAVKDANDMQDIAVDTYGYQSQALLTDSDATSENVIQSITDAIALCEDGDILLISYSGHGATLENIWTSDDDEKYDSTWCLYDRQLLDDELYDIFSSIEKKVRVLVVSDSCHSGTITREYPSDEKGASSIANNWISKKLSKDAAKSNQSKHFDFYKTFQTSVSKPKDEASVNASVLLLAACQDNQETYDTVSNGIFTKALKEILSTERINGPQDILDRISNIYDAPNPNILSYGKASLFFTEGDPFSI